MKKFFKMLTASILSCLMVTCLIVPISAEEKTNRYYYKIDKKSEEALINNAIADYLTEKNISEEEIMEIKVVRISDEPSLRYNQEKLGEERDVYITTQETLQLYLYNILSDND